MSVRSHSADCGELDHSTIILGRVASEAIDCAQRGWHVFPVPRGTRKSHKSERISGRPWGASADPDQIRRDWRKWPHANLGIRCGPASDIFVVDVDTLEGHGVDGFASLDTLIAENGELPLTIEAVSPTGSRHIYFRWPEDGGIVNSASKVGPGIDVRGDGGMVVAPPSVKPDKGEYRWQNPPGLFEPAECPEWLLRLIRAPKDLGEVEPPASIARPPSADGTRERSYALSVLDGCCAELAGTANGGRNDRLNRVAYRLGTFIGAGMIGEQEVRAGLEQACEVSGLWRDDGPLQCRATIKGAIRKGMAHPHTGLSDEAMVRAGDMPPIADAGAKTIAGRSWRRQNLMTMPARRFLYGRLLQRGKVTVTVAPGGVGKSALTGATEALAMTTGRKLLHDDVGAPLRVWVWNLEEDQDELNRRLEAACVHYGIEGEVDGLFVDNGFDMPCRMASADRNGVNIVRPLTDAIVAEVKRLKVDVLVIDPFVSTHFVNENDNGQIDVVAKEWARVANEAGCAVHLVHHTTKMRGLEVTAESSRGAIALVNAARVARALNPMTEDEAKSYGIKDGWRYFRATDGKANYAPRSDASQWFAHVSVHLPNGDNVGVVAPYELPNMADGVTVDHLDEVVRRAGEGTYREHELATNWIGIMVADVLGADLDMPADKKRVKASVAMWLKSGALKVVERKDEGRKVRKFVVPGDVDPFVADTMESRSAAHKGGEE
ncbi:MAG: bifunctional DNA primase/polymerase [Devosia sp.]